MISIYANLYNGVPDTPWSDGTTETLLFTIPNQNGSIRPFLTATLNNDMGSAGSFEFTVDPKSIWYDIWRHMRTLIRIEYDGDTIFYGRVLTIDRDMFRNRKIHCEGAMTFFSDSLFCGQKNGTAMTLTEYLTTLINAHNECMEGAPEKKIYLGEVPGNYSETIVAAQKIPEDQQKYGSDGYKTVKECLEGLVSDYGGYMRVRYEEGTMYLDWLQLYYKSDVSTQMMRVDTNAIDLSDTIEVNNIFTHIIPVGKNNKYIDGGGGGGGGGEKHRITVTAVADDEGVGTRTGGEAHASLTLASKGTKITLYQRPYYEYWFSYWHVVSGGIVIQNDSFEMGDNDVSIEAMFIHGSGGGGGEDPDA